VPKVILDVTHATKVFAWQPRVDLDEGVARTWRWMCGAAFNKTN